MESVREQKVIEGTDNDLKTAKKLLSRAHDYIMDLDENRDHTPAIMKDIIAFLDKD